MMGIQHTDPYAEINYRPAVECCFNCVYYTLGWKAQSLEREPSCCKHSLKIQPLYKCKDHTLTEVAHD